MTLLQFRLLDKAEKLETTWNSPLVGTIEDENFTYELHQVDAFFIEVKYRKQNRSITGIKTFKYRDLLPAYLAQIDINKAS